MRAEAPGGLKRRATREHGVEAQRRHLVDQQRQQFQGRGVHPVEVFDDHEHGLLLGQCPHQGQEHSKVRCRCCSGGSGRGG